MDTGILLNIIDDILKDEKSYEIQAKLAALKNFLTQSKTQSKARDSINTTIDELKEKLTSGHYDRFSNSYFKAIKHMKGSKYVGESMIAEIDKIFLQDKYSVTNQIKKLDTLINARKKFYDNLKTVKDSLATINFKPHYHSLSIYQIGIIIPDKGDLHYATYLENAIHNWNLIIKGLRELTGAEVEEIKIERVQEGCIELIIEVIFQVAQSLGDIIEKLITVYAVISKIKTHIKGLKEQGVDQKQLKPIEESQANKIDEEINKLVDAIIEKHKAEGVDPNRLNELRTQLKKGVAYIAKSLDKGVEIEILPPYIIRDEEEVKDGDTKEQLANKKKIKAANDKMEKEVDLIKDIGKVLKTTGELGSDAFKLLKGGEGKID